MDSVSFFICLCISLSYVLAQQGCVSPPMECPNENITFWLYTKTNQDSPHQVFALNSDSISSAPWVEDAPIKILIHGYTGHRDFSPSTEIRPGQVTIKLLDFEGKFTSAAPKVSSHALMSCSESRAVPRAWYCFRSHKLYGIVLGTSTSRASYMRCCDYNIISVDYNPIAREPCYFQAARNTELVGKCTAQLIDQLVTQHGFELQRFHVIGFSLGGQTAGFIGNYVTSGKLERISALDPAMPLFVSQDNKKKVDASDAKMVDCLHTNALEKGKLETCGTVDFYANGGLTQPGCKPSQEHTKSGCDHARAPAYYAESIITEVGFYATKCTSWITHMIGWCNYVSSDEEVLFGEYMPHNISGLYFFATNSKSPYARGRNKKQSRRSLFTL